MEPVLEAKNITLSYNKGTSYEMKGLDKVNIKVYPGEYVILFGPSGCGKSTLLYSILGLQDFDTGELLIQGKDIKTLKESERVTMASRVFGMVFQQYNLIQSLNVIDNVTLPQVFIKEPSANRQKKAIELLTRMGIAGKAHFLPNNLSGGQQQRVAICRALINEPQVILADEPVGNLDSESARIVLRSLYDINVKDKKTIVLVTHDSRYLPYADKIYFMKDGKVLKEVKQEKMKFGAEVAQTDDMKLETMKKLARVEDLIPTNKLKAREVAQYALGAMTNGQMDTLESYIDNFITKKMTKEAFVEGLDQAPDVGGVGLRKTEAAQITKEVTTMMEAHACVELLTNKSLSEFERIATVKGVMPFLFEGSHELKGPIYLIFEEAVMKVLCGRIDENAFYALLINPEDKGGVGMRVLRAQHILQRIQLLLSL